MSIVSVGLSIIAGWISSLLFDDSLLGVGFGVIVLNILLSRQRRTSSIDWNFFSDRLSHSFLRCYPLFHLVSLFSSSFIEEEHQCWYYFLSTSIVLIALEERSLRWLIVVVGLRGIRQWNQTGNKFLNSPDLADWINRDEHRLVLFVLHSICSILFAVLLKNRRVMMFLPILVWIFRWNLFGFVELFASLSGVNCLLLFSSWTSFVPMIGYLLLLVNRLSLDEFVFSLLFLLCRTHQSVLLLLHWLFYRSTNVQRAPLAFLFSQAAFFHLVRSTIFSFRIRRSLVI